MVESRHKTSKIKDYEKIRKLGKLIEIEGEEENIEGSQKEFFSENESLRTEGKLSEAEAWVNLRHCYSAVVAIWQFRF